MVRREFEPIFDRRRNNRFFFESFFPPSLLMLAEDDCVGPTVSMLLLRLPMEGRLDDDSGLGDNGISLIEEVVEEILLDFDFRDTGYFDPKKDVRLLAALTGLRVASELGDLISDRAWAWGTSLTRAAGEELVEGLGTGSDGLDLPKRNFRAAKLCGEGEGVG